MQNDGGSGLPDQAAPGDGFKAEEFVRQVFSKGLGGSTGERVVNVTTLVRSLLNLIPEDEREEAVYQILITSGVVERTVLFSAGGTPN
jgi:hypothetical protein